MTNRGIYVSSSERGTDINTFEDISKLTTNSLNSVTDTAGEKAWGVSEEEEKECKRALFFSFGLRFSE